MLGSGKTGRVCASATASSARSRDSYQRYAVALYRHALLTLDNSALSVTWRPSCAVLRRLTTSPAAAVKDGDQAGGTAAGRR
jgi:hypothetical protein